MYIGLKHAFDHFEKISIFFQAGAKQVFAVEPTTVSEDAEKVIQVNGLGERIKILKSRVEDLKLKDKVDVIVSEWMGYCLVYEGMLPSVILAG